MLVEIYVPSFDRTYEFRLDDDTVVSAVIEEICSVICEKEHCELSGNINKMMLFNRQRGSGLNNGRTLYENGVLNGDKLILT